MSFADYSYERFAHDVDHVTQEILQSKQEYDFIVGLGRGGFPLAVCLSHRLDIPMYPIMFGKRRDDRLSHPFVECQIITASNRILVVDDMVDSGEVLYDLFTYFDFLASGRLDLSRFDVAVLLNNTDVEVIYRNESGKLTCNFAGTNFSREVNPEWINFWWEC